MAAPCVPRDPSVGHSNRSQRRRVRRLLKKFRKETSQLDFNGVLGFDFGLCRAMLLCEQLLAIGVVAVAKAGSCFVDRFGKRMRSAD